MKALFKSIQIFILIIALVIFIGAIIIASLGVYDIIHSALYFKGSTESTEHIIIFTALGIMRSVDLLLISIVLFIFSLGLLILFDGKEETVQKINLPKWLRVKNFMELKVILWEAILTTMLISVVSVIAQKIQGGQEPTISLLILPGAILLVALALFFVKRGEKE